MSGSGEPAGAAPNPSSGAAAAAAAAADDPAALGFRMPAEWEPHERTWMGWPQRPDNWRDRASHAQKAFVDVATAISQFEPVTICANEEQARDYSGLVACRYQHLANCTSLLESELPGRHTLLSSGMSTHPSAGCCSAGGAAATHLSCVHTPGRQLVPRYWAHGAPGVSMLRRAGCK